MVKVKQRVAATYKKKRSHGNQHTRNEASIKLLTMPAPHTEPPQIPSTPPTAEQLTDNFTPTYNIRSSASSSKVKDIDTSSDDTEIPLLSGYRFIDISILSDIINSFACPECFHSGLTLQEHKSKQKGFSIFMSVVCQCGYSKHFYSSKTANKGKRYDINTRIVYASRSCGVGYAGIEKFTGLMNMPKPMSKTTYNNISTNIRNATKIVAEQSMADAAREVNSSDGIVNTGVSVDGTWQRRGYSSLNGVVTAISIKNGKILDTEPLSRHCKVCEGIEKFKNIDNIQYESKKAGHFCKANYSGSAPNMEPEGAKRIFARSVEKHKLQYTDFYGDGDSKSHPAVENIYDDVKVKKLECIGHVQKRVGNRLCKLKSRVKGLGGRGKLTNAVIDRLQNYYRIAIRSNKDNLEGMKNAVLASLFHVSSSKDNEWHDYCPRTTDSWCLFERDKINKTSTYKSGVGIPRNIVLENLRPIYKDLSSDALLQKCLHRLTQNANESFNAMIWDRIPKSRYIGFTQLEIGVYDAVANFNDGRSASIDILKQMGLEPGINCELACKSINEKRINNSLMKSTDISKIRRKVIRGRKKQKDDKNVEKEGKTYEAGGFI